MRVIDLDSPSPRRTRSRLYLAIAAAVLVVAGAGGFLVYRAAQDTIRFEVETASGSALQIRWNAGIDQMDYVAGDPAGEPFPTPWSHTVQVEDISEHAMLMVMSTDTDTVTCRVVANGETVKEVTATRAAGCPYNVPGLDFE